MFVCFAQQCRLTLSQLTASMSVLAIHMLSCDATSRSNNIPDTEANVHVMCLASCYSVRVSVKAQCGLVPELRRLPQLSNSFK